ncbi:putative zinc-binding dehydrogenase family oxidoreductase [Chaetomidium leptoderma]|uniref:Zinc-binding dehydrogenase family oxidoreductase n=1 Tax=Chaetomidium leptoderma TaxID=669021 RepID=A0AAN6VV03_9PEZI|nr:putative zinc-binding dehydrogenase family oxidoreductase [Chaetomidium leptoderma]
MAEPSATQTAIVGSNDGQVELSTLAQVAATVGDIVLVRNKAVAVNPVDTKMAGPFITPGAILGSDFAGVVERAGPDAANHGIRVGDRVCGVLMGMNPLEPALGAFAELVGCHAADLLRIPDGVGFDEAASMNMGAMTAGLALFKVLDVPGYPLQAPTGPQPATVLVYGGSTATGTTAIQLLKLAGLRVIATCSPANFDMVRGYGADATFDYRDPAYPVEIRAFTKNSLRLVLDCISTTQSMEFCYSVVGRSGGRYTALEPFSPGIAATRKLIKPDWVLAPVMLGRPIGWPVPYKRDVMSDMVEFSVKWVKTLQELYDKRLLRPHPLVVRSGDLAGVLEGLQEVRAGKLSGKKLVYTL